MVSSVAKEKMLGGLGKEVKSMVRKEKLIHKNSRVLQIHLNSGQNLFAFTQYCLCFTITLTNCMWTSLTPPFFSQGTITLIFGALCLLLTLESWLVNRRATLQNRKLITLIIVFLMLVVSMIPLKTKAGSYLLYYSFPLLSCCLCFGTIQNVSDFWKRYMNVVVALCMLSLFFYFFGSVFHIISPSGTVAYHWGYDLRCNNYYNLYYEAFYGRTSILEFLPRKNTGFYTEPPMFVFIICLGLAAELSFSEAPRKLPIILSIFTILTTMATTGFIFLLAMGVLYVLLSGKGEMSQRLKAIGFPFIVVTTLLVLLEIYEQKISSVSGANSAGIRIDHMLTAFQMWEQKPVFGFGYGQQEQFERLATYSQGASVGLPLFLAYGGIWSTSLYFVPLIRSIFDAFRYNKKHLYFIIGTFILLFLTSVNYLPTMICIMSSLLMVETRSPTEINRRYKLG